MDQELELIKTLSELKQEGNPVKDYIYPIIVTFIGAFFAHYAVKYQNYIASQKEKLETANKWVVTFQSAFEGLVSIKRNYYTKLTDEPFKRSSAIPEVIHSAEKIDLDLGGLSFLVPDLDDEFAADDKWRSLPRINAMKKNYNFLLEAWNKRNNLASIITPRIIASYGEQGVANINFQQALNCVGQENFLPYIDLTEYVVKTTDELMIEIYDFVSNFRKSARECIDTGRIRIHGKLLSYENKNPEFEKIMVRCPTVDHRLLAQMFNSPEGDLAQRYETGYEDLTYSTPSGEKTVEENIEEYKTKERLKKKFRWWW